MPISNVYTNPLDESNVLLKRSTLSPSSFQAQSAPVSHLLFFFIDPGAEPQVLPSANRVDLSSQLSTAPAGTVGLSRHKRPTSRPRLPTLLAVSLFRFFFSFLSDWPVAERRAKGHVQSDGAHYLPLTRRVPLLFSASLPVRQPARQRGILVFQLARSFFLSLPSLDVWQQRGRAYLARPSCAMCAT